MELAQRASAFARLVERQNRAVFNDWGCYTFTQMLVYKCQLSGKELVKLDERNTSKTCSRCGQMQDMPLWKRTYHCENCGLVMDRDDNSADNILARFFARRRSHGGFLSDPKTVIEMVVNMFYHILKGSPVSMYVIEAQNYRQALYNALQIILSDGYKRSPRGLGTRELQDVSIVINNPCDRVALLPGRKANIFATLAETLWVLAGRDDLEFIGYYLQRIADFSDDGVVLHGAYGPRIKNWRGVNQLAEVLRILKSDPDSRRAVIALFDPACDFDTRRKDIPCNNWMQFSLRDGKLHMRVVSRSMDVIWGSTINVFEWTVIQELLSRQLGVSPGGYTHFVGSLHLYEDFLQRVHEILAHPLNMTRYNTVPWDIPFESLDEQLEQFIAQESAMRSLIAPTLDKFSSSLLRVATQMCWGYALHKNREYQKAWEVVQQLPDCDLKAAALDFFSYNKNYRVLRDVY